MHALLFSGEFKNTLHAVMHFLFLALGIETMNGIQHALHN